MSLYSLRSEVSRLESRLSEEQAINRELRNELAIIANGVSRAQNILENFNIYIQDTLVNSDNMLHSSHQKVIDAYNVQSEIERLYERFKNIELATKKIRAANNKKYYDFGNYRTVRKIVQGIMDNLDVNMISDSTIARTVEKQHLQTPDYWLTCALISVIAWKNDDRELAERSVARALSIDKKRSSIFYMLFNLRMRRNEAAVKWFCAYQECEQTGGDQRTFLMLFSLISRTITESIDDKTRDEISTYINEMILFSARSEGYSEDEIILKIRGAYARSLLLERLDYSILSRYCAAFGELTDNMALVKNNVNILENILKIVNVPASQKNEFLKGYVDELIASPNDAEESVYDEIAYNELVIKMEGDADAAREAYAVERKRAKSRLNLVSEMVNWIYDRENTDVSGQVRLNMFTLTKALQEKAAVSYAEYYRRRRKFVLPVTIDDYSTNVDFRDESAEIEKIEAHYTAVRDDGLATIKNWKGYAGFGAAALFFAIAFFIGLWLLVFSAAGVGYAIYVLQANKSLRNQLESTRAANIKAVGDITRRMFAEFELYNAQFDDYDAYHDRIINELSKL